LTAVANGSGLSEQRLLWSDQFAVTTVVASAGYPNNPHKGLAIGLPPKELNVYIFHAGTALNSAGELVSAGGRVFAVTGVAPTLGEAQSESARAAGAIELDGKQFRRDIGWRELERGAGATRD